MDEVRRARWSRRLRSPVLQLGFAFAVMVGGAWLIALWAVGVVLVVGGGGLMVDAVLRDSLPARDLRQSSVDDVLERYRRAR